jgi:putative Mg2+ transporter-C (MgtC) family protein
MMFWETFLHDLRPEILFRLGLSMIAGFIIGLEREAHGRAAGLRTTLIVCLSSCVAMIVSDSFYRESFKGVPSNWHPDPARLAAGILAGMGFLGAGVIVHHRDNVVRGVTTAATLWFAAIIGLALGAGSVGIGVLSVALSMVILRFIPRFENSLQNDWYSDISIHLASDDASTDSAVRIIESHDIKIKGLDWKENLADGERVIQYHVKYKKGERLTLPGKVISALRELSNVKSVHWHG